LVLFLFFQSLFPSQIQPFVAIIANTIFNLLVRIKICKQPPKRYNVSSLVTGNSSSNSHVTISIPLIQNQENSDAERRRLKALKALKERLKKPDEEDDMKAQWSSDAINNSTASTTNLIEQSSSGISSGVTNAGAVSSSSSATLVSQVDERADQQSANMKIIEDGLD
jgi:hypothetical protein